MPGSSFLRRRRSFGLYTGRMDAITYNTFCSELEKIAKLPRYLREIAKREAAAFRRSGLSAPRTRPMPSPAASNRRLDVDDYIESKVQANMAGRGRGGHRWDPDRLREGWAQKRQMREALGRLQ